MNKFREWYMRYSDEITWWIIGWLSFSGLDAIVRGNWGFAILDVALIVLNYKLWKNNNA